VRIGSARCKKSRPVWFKNGVCHPCWYSYSWASDGDFETLCTTILEACRRVSRYFICCSTVCSVRFRGAPRRVIHDIPGSSKLSTRSLYNGWIGDNRWKVESDQLVMIMCRWWSLQPPHFKHCVYFQAYQHVGHQDQGHTLLSNVGNVFEMMAAFCAHLPVL
jgi:hypothetical protein